MPTYSSSPNYFDIRAPIDTGMFNKVKSPLKTISSNSFRNSVNFTPSSSSPPNRSFDQRSSWGMTPGGSPRN